MVLQSTELIKEVDGTYPLSHGQRALWFLQQLDPHSAAYNVARAVRIRTPLHLPIFRQAWQRLAERHPVLRSTFANSATGPVQKIHSDVELDYAEEDATDWLPHHLEARLAEETYRPFDLEREFPLRVRVLQRGPNDVVVLFVLHHIACDLWSLILLLAEVPQLYQSILNNAPLALKKPRRTYSDFVQVEEKMLASEDGQQHWDYWRERLSGELPQLDLPTDYPRPSVPTGQAASVASLFPAEQTQRLRALAAAQGAPLHTLVTTAFQTLLHRYTGQTDIMIGSPRAGRSADMAGVMGYFVNALALRANLAGDPTFSEALARAHHAVTEDFAHGAFPFSLIVERLQPIRDANRSPIFQVMLAWQKTTRLADWNAIAAINAGEPGVSFQSGGLTIESIPFPARTTDTDLALLIIETAGGLSLVLEYDTALFEEATAARTLQHFSVLLAGIAENPHCLLSQLPVLTEAERNQLAAWNNTQRDIAGLPLVHQQVEAQAAATPNAIAVTCGDEALNYRELNERANQLAHALRALGVNLETPVGLCLPRSLNLIVGALAVLKAGGAYVALDPANPAERLAFMLTDSQAPVLLTTAKIAEQLPATQTHILKLDADGPRLANLPTHNLDGSVAPDNLAYIIYTSGSTGQPKGVLIEHRSLVNLVAWHQTAFGVTPADRATQIASPGFDVVVEEIWPYLAAGASIHIPHDNIRTDPSALQAWLVQQAITLTDLPTPLAESLIVLMWPPHTALRCMLTGGDTLRAAPPPNLPFTFVNNYGPTEATVTATSGAVLPNDSEVAPSIGRPIANTQVHILDANQHPLPVGVPGDLYISGLGLARGYLNQPDLTAEKFIYMNSTDDKPRRLYRTGDRARWLPDGDIEFLGRADTQVKIRGFRIELSEIEAALLQHPAVQEAAVVAHTLKTGQAGSEQKRLAAYIVRRDAALTADALRTHLKDKLPDYMVPAAFTWMDALAFTANGKLDRKALPQPEWGASETAIVLPRTPAQEMLANIWREVLHIDRISIQDSFFDLGGHSLLATQVAARIREIFRIDLPLRTLFEAQTIETLAAQIESALIGDRQMLAPPIVPINRDQTLPLSFSQERMWFIHQLDPNGSAYNVVTVIRLKGPLSVAAVQYSMDELCKRHESLRTTFPTQNGQPVQRIAPSISLPLVQVDLRHLPEDECEPKLKYLLEEEAARPFDLEHGPLFRVVLFRVGDEDWIQLSSMHHIITDAWSMMVLDQDSNTLYNAHVRGEPATLPPLPVQYADYAYWQRQWLQGEGLDAQLAYWRNQLAGAPPLDLTPDHPRPPIQTYHGSFESADLDDDLLDDMQRVAASESATPFMVGLAAFYMLLHRYTAQADLSVGVPIANREFFQSEQLIGSLVNTLVMRADLSGNPTFRELLRQVRTMALDAYTHQNLPFAKLVAELNPVRNTAVSPLVQVMFNMVNVPQPKMELEGLEVEVVEVDRRASQFDLTFTLVDVPDFRSVSVEYNLDLFEQETMAQMLAHYQALLRLAVAEPDQPIGAYPLLNQTERRRLLHDWNATRTDYDRERTLTAALAEQVVRTPHAVALKFGASAWTYAELNRRANQIAHHLVKLGAQPGTLVGICMARSAAAIAGMLGALKAGCAYVPLDPAYPTERIEYMIRDAQMPILLADNQTLAAASRHSAHVVNLDADWPMIAQTSDEDINPVDDINRVSSASDTAYVIYTSGSTGKPKGVMGTHRGALNRAHWMWRVYPFAPGEVLCQKTSFNFIDAVWEIFGPLLHGVPSVILPDAVVKDPDALVSAMAQGGVTRITLVPSLLKVLLETHPKLDAELPLLRMCVSSGEALAIDLAKQFMQRMPHTRLLNLYGSSEASGDSTYYEVTAQSAHAFVPIGQPMDNVQTYVLDAARQLVPMGVPGELYLGGDGLALGYLHQPVMTAERFVAHPFSADPDAWLYKTGDRVRYLSDGNVQYLGRNDDQIKIRGMRVTTGEIEAVLKQHEGIAEVVVMAREDRSGNLQLVAYIVALPDAHVSGSELRAFAEAQLPGHMVPRGFVMLPALPLTPNGKLDKRALPAYEEEKRRADDLVAPRDEIERKLIPIWQRVLEHPQVSVTDDFFELGGHSLLAVQLFAQIENDFAIKLPLSTLFQSSTPEGLARVLRRGALQHTPQRPSPLVPIQPNGDKPPFFCVHPVGGGVFGYAALSRYLGDDQPFYGLEARPEEANDPMRRQMAAMADHYIQAIRTVQPHGPYYLGGYSFGATLSYAMACRLVAQGETVGLLAMFDHAAPKSDYYAWPRLSARVVGGFLSNLSHWLADFNQIPLRERLGRLRRKMLASQPAPQNGSIDLNRYMDDVSLVPQETHALIRAHLAAWEGYQPQPYAGPVTVFCTRRQPLICSYDPHMAWDSLAKGGVKMVPVAGSHRNLLAEPDVQSLAGALKQALAHTHARVS